MFDRTVPSRTLQAHAEQTEILAAAVELQARSEARADTEFERRAVLAAADELGVTEHLARAEHLVAERRRAHLRRRTLARWTSLAAAALALGVVAAAHALAPPAPWSDRLDDHARWTLASNPESMTALEWTRDGAREVATVYVDVFGKGDQTGSWQADLAGIDLPALDGHETLTIELQGTLLRARLALLGGPDERWLSPSIEVSSPWTLHRLALRSFDHQRLTRGRWRSVPDSDREDPTRLERLVLTLGEPVNPRRASGVVRIRAIGAQ